LKNIPKHFIVDPNTQNSEVAAVKHKISSVWYNKFHSINLDLIHKIPLSSFLVHSLTNPLLKYKIQLIRDSGCPSVPSQDNERLNTRNVYMFMRFQFIRGSDCPSVPSQDNERLYTRNVYMFMRFQFIRGSDCPQCTKSGQWAVIYKKCIHVYDISMLTLFLRISY
jgi:Zn ribbon nucleic-acid-binding protein